MTEINTKPAAVTQYADGYDITQTGSTGATTYTGNLLRKLATEKAGLMALAHKLGADYNELFLENQRLMQDNTDLKAAVTARQLDYDNLVDDYNALYDKAQYHCIA